jgi:hypothetical protein
MRRPAQRKRLCTALTQDQEDDIINGIISGAIDRKLLPFFNEAPLHPDLENALNSLGSTMGILAQDISDGTTNTLHRSAAVAKVETFGRSCGAA